CTLPFVMFVVLPPSTMVPEISWKVCVSLSSPCGSFQVPPTLAGTIQRRAVHQLEQLSVIEAVSSGFQSPIVNVFDTIRGPGFQSRIFGRSLRLISGRRNIVMTVA